MIVKKFDGVNVTIVLDVVELKAIRSLLNVASSSVDGCQITSALLYTDGHLLTPDDVKSVGRQFALSTARLAKYVTEKEDNPNAVEKAEKKTDYSIN